MGVSNDAQLVFGFAFDEEDKPEFLGEFDDLDDYLVDKAFPHLSVDGPDRLLYEKRRPIIEACPAVIERHCSYDYPMYILAVRGTRIWANRGYTEVITPEKLVVAPEKITAFKTWCEENDIEYQEPQWLLCSMNG